MTDNTDSLLARFFETAETPLALLDRQGAFVRANGAWKSLASEASIAVGAPFVDLLVPADADRVRALFAQLEGAAQFDANVSAAASGGADRLFRFHATLDPTSGTIQIVGVVAVSADQAAADVTARQQVMLKTFSHIVDTTPVVLWATDSSGVLTMHEGKGLERVGMQPRVNVGQNMFELFKDFPHVLEAVVRGFGGEESRMVDPFPGDIHFDSWILPMKGEDGAIHGVVGLAIDATDRVRKERELEEKLELIGRQSATIRALATPIIQIWDEVICLPIIGTVDSERTADMMHGLLEAIVREQARYAIVDLTGVEVVDTSTADHLIRLFRAAKVLGVDGVLCGIRPAVAQTVVALGLDLTSVRMMRSLRDALMWCIRARGTATALRGAARPQRAPATSAAQR